MSPSGKIVKRDDFKKSLNLQEQVNEEGSVNVAPPLSEKKVISEEEYRATAVADKILDSARMEAREIRKEAEGVLRRVHEEMEKSRKIGFEEGRKKGESEVAHLLTAALHAKEKMFLGVEKDAVRLVYDIAEKILGAELHGRETAIVDLIKQALHAAIGQKIVILVNPQDLERVKANEVFLMQAIDSSRSLQVRGDEKVAPKGCVIETEVGTIDAQLDTQLSAIKKVLGLESDKETGGEK